MADVETVTFTVEGPDGETDSFEVPTSLLDVLAEPDDTQTGVVADIAVMSFASRAHHLAHHGHGDAPDIGDAEGRMMDEFEDRFGVTFAEATGHSH